jgi:hypothetical protein
MSVKDELNDPWSYVVGGLAGGMAFAVGIFPPAAVGIGAAVLATKVLAGVFSRPGRTRAARRKERRLPVITRTQEAAWLARAESAEESFHEVAASAQDGPVAERVRQFGVQVEDALGALQRLAGQCSAVRLAMSRIDPRRLQFERERLTRDATSGVDPAVLAERRRSLASVQTQLDTYQRLAIAITTLLARLESGTLGIEGLVARLAEVVALSETTGTSADFSQVDELAQELEGLRAGLVETEGVTRRAMEGLPPMPDAVPGAGTGTVPTTEPVRRRATE